MCVEDRRCAIQRKPVTVFSTIPYSWKNWFSCWLLWHWLKPRNRNVLVCSGFWFGNKIPNTVWLISKKHLFLTVLEARKSETKAWEDLVSGFRWESACWFRGPSSCCVLSWRRGKELSGASFIRAWITFRMSPPLQPNHVSKAPHPNTIRYQPSGD